MSSVPRTPPLLLLLCLCSSVPREYRESAPRIGQSTTAETASDRTGANDDGAFSACATLASSRLSSRRPLAAGTQSRISETSSAASASATSSAHDDERRPLLDLSAEAAEAEAAEALALTVAAASERKAESGLRVVAGGGEVVVVEEST